jgi:hypothetical protein
VSAAERRAAKRAALTPEQREARKRACTRCGQPLGLRAFSVSTVDGERHEVCPAFKPRSVRLLTLGEIADLLVDSLDAYEARQRAAKGEP